MRQTDLPRAPQAASHARAFVRRHFGADLSDDAFRNVLTVLSELVNNAVVHGEGRITLKAQLSGGSLRVEVVDEGTAQAPAIREQGADDEGGWGLRLVDRLSARWGAYEGTTHVWADISTD